MSVKVQIPKSFDIAVDLNDIKQPYASLKGQDYIHFNEKALVSFNFGKWEPVYYDALLVAAAIEWADRKTPRGAFCWERQIRLNVPLHEPERWQDPRVCDPLKRALAFLTGDRWSLSFQKLEEGFPALRDNLDLSNRYEHVMAYSEGLDSRCVSGLYDKAKLVKVRVGKSRVSRPAKEPFTAIPFEVKIKHPRDDVGRARGFKFAMISAIGAHLCGSSSIIVPESGQGALGPSLAGLARHYPDYRNHPAFFRLMEAFVEALLGQSIGYHQPRLWSTKGQTLRAYLNQDGADRKAVQQTRSCWQTRYNTSLGDGRRQCGLCSACQLRRLSFHAAGVEEPEEAYVWSDLSAPSYEAATPKGFRPTDSMKPLAVAGVQHLEHLARLHIEDSAGQLPSHARQIAAATGQRQRATMHALSELLAAHFEEWTNYKKSLGKVSFIGLWAGGNA